MNSTCETQKSVGPLSDEELNRQVHTMSGWLPYDGNKQVDYMWAPGHISQVIPSWIHKNATTDSPNWTGKSIKDLVPNFMVNLPDYCHDLNAMHEIECSLSPELWRKYIVKFGELDFPIKATARQRAEAFVLSMEVSDPKGADSVLERNAGMAHPVSEKE